MRKFQRVSDIRAEHPGVKGYILQGPSGPSFILKTNDADPEGRFCLLGIIER